MNFKVGDIVKTKKKHPCGSYEWEVIRVGADYKIKCLGCSHVVMLQSEKFKKIVKNKVEQ